MDPDGQSADSDVQLERTAEEWLDLLRPIIEFQLGVELKDITLTANFFDDFDADSLDIVELIMAIEEASNVKIPDKEAEAIATVQDLINFLSGNPERSG
ncbi:MAG: acyl carrier protein [Patescibacteria group bacterium]